MLRTLELYVADLHSLTEVRASQADLATKAESWQGLSDPPPYSPDLTDRLRTEISAQEAQIASLKVEQTVIGDQLDDYRAALKEAEVSYRQANEALERSKDTALIPRLRWQRDLAALRKRYNEVQAARIETRRTLNEESIDYRQQQIEFLRRQLAVAMPQTEFTAEERDAKLALIADKLASLEKEKRKAERDERVALEALQRAREDLRSAREALAESAHPTPAQELQITRLESQLDLRKAQADTSSDVLESLRLLGDIARGEQLLWQSRYSTASGDVDAVKAALSGIDQGAERIKLWRSYLRTKLDTSRALVASQQRVIADWKPEKGAIGPQQDMLTAYSRRVEASERVLAAISVIDQLVQRYREDLEARYQDVTVLERAEALLKRSWGLARAAWNFELFTVEDTIVVDGQPITGKRSITVSKVAQVLLILLVGFWLTGVVARSVQRLLVSRFKVTPHAGALAHGVVRLVLILSLFVFALTTVKIPLTVFAFLGGALAIGVGFGAQNLINNFISGAILLLERPIKLGDIVEVEGVRGRVVDIGARCSQIKRFDGVDLLIPNSSFLEKNVINITLEDRLTRAVVEVGVAYGSPVDEVALLLRKVAEEHLRVMRDPAPLVMFHDFGADALLFRLEFWVELTTGVDPRVVASDIRHRIDHVFREHDISIAFPQRDVHLSAGEPLPVHIVERPDVRPTPPEPDPRVIDP